MVLESPSHKLGFNSILSIKSVSILSIELCLLHIMVERWKNLVFLSPSRNQISRDFCFQTVSFLVSHSSNSPCSFASFLALLTDISWPWISTIFSVSSVIQVWQKPKTFLFHFFRADFVSFCFLQSFTPGHPVKDFFQALRTTSLQEGSLSQAISKQKGLGEEVLMK